MVAGASGHTHPSGLKLFSLFMHFLFLVSVHATVHVVTLLLLLLLLFMFSARYFGCVTPLVGAFVDDYGDDNDDCNGFDGIANDGAASLSPPITLCPSPIAHFAHSPHAALQTGRTRCELSCFVSRRSCPRFDCCASFFPSFDASSGPSFVDFLIISPWTDSFGCFTAM